MNKTKKLWTVTVARYTRDANGVERRKRKPTILGLTAMMTKREARRAARVYIDQANASAFYPTQEQKFTTFEAFADVWEQDYLSLSKPSTQASMRGHVKRLKEHFGPKEMRRIDAADLQRFVAALVAEGYEPKTIRNYGITSALIWKAALVQGYVDQILPKPKLPRVFRKTPRHLVLAEVGRLLYQARSEEDREVFSLLWLAAEAGLRSGELDGLRLEDVSEESVTIRQTIWNGHAGIPKTPNALRTVAVSPKLSAMLAAQARYAKSYGHGYLYAFSATYYRDRLQCLLKKLEIKQAGLHALRHFNASLMDSLRIPLKTRQERLGHASTGSLTLDVYTHAKWEHNVEAAQLLGDAINQAVKDAENSVSLTAVKEEGLLSGVSEALGNKQ